ncbi:hypothetical protein H4S03_006939 [Coemansia sp. S3946]|nr:hypothetical protein H4S03_006939 [Coemansia sp. S3946]
MTPDSLTAAEIVFSGGSTYMDKFVEKAFGEIAKSLFSNTKYSKVDLDSLGSLEFDNNFRKLRTVAIVEAKDYDSPDTVGDFVLSKSLKNLIDSARILNLIADCYVKNLVASYGREFEHIKVLDMGLTQLTLFDTMRLLRALPNLVKLSCGIGKLGSELSNIPSKELPDHMVTTYRAVGNRLYNLNTSLEKGISVIEAADFVMLLTLVCPRLRRVGSSHAAPPAYYARITKALNRKPFSKYASQLQHLLDNAGQQTRQFVIMVPLINHHGLFTI